MEQQLFKLAAGNGIWSALFVFLFLYVLYDSKKRESKYQETIKENLDIIKELSQKFGIVEDIQNGVTCIKDELKNK